MKPHVRIRPQIPPWHGWEWALDHYDGRGAWSGSSYHHTKRDAQRAAHRVRRLFREDEARRQAREEML